MSDNNSQNPMQQMFQMYMQGQFNNNNMPQNQGVGANQQQQMPFFNQQQQMPMGNQQQMPMGNQQMNMGFNPAMFMGNPQMNTGFNPAMFQGNMFFPFPFFPQNVNQVNQVQQPNQNSEDWSLIFKRKQDGQSLTIQISNDKTLAEAINRYRIKSGDMVSNKFTSNNKPLNLGLTLNQSGLANNSQIDAEQDSSGFVPNNQFGNSLQGDQLNLLFELKAGGQTMNIQITPDKTVGDAINSYRNKIQIEGEMKFIFNGLNLDPRLTLKAAGLKNNSKILVITTKDIEGA
jgi:hypothetical protein